MHSLPGTGLYELLLRGRRLALLPLLVGEPLRGEGAQMQRGGLGHGTPGRGRLCVLLLGLRVPHRQHLAIFSLSISYHNICLE